MAVGRGDLSRRGQEGPDDGKRADGRYLIERETSARRRQMRETTGEGREVMRLPRKSGRFGERRRVDGVGIQTEFDDADVATIEFEWGWKSRVGYEMSVLGSWQLPADDLNRNRHNFFRQTSKNIISDGSDSDESH